MDPADPEQVEPRAALIRLLPRAAGPLSGTLAEAAIVWAALQTEPAAPDLIFVGSGWPAVLESLGAHLVIDDRDLSLVTICPNPRLAIARIAETQAGRLRAPSPRG